MTVFYLNVPFLLNGERPPGNPISNSFAFECDYQGTLSPQGVGDYFKALSFSGVVLLNHFAVVRSIQPWEMGI